MDSSRWPYGHEHGWIAGRPLLPEQHQWLSSHLSAQITASTKKQRTSKITSFPAVTLRALQHQFAQLFSVPRLSNTIQCFQIFGSFQPTSLFVLVSNCCSMLPQAKLSLTGEPQPAQPQLHGDSGGSEDAGYNDGCLSHCSDVSFPLHSQHSHLKAVVCFDNSTQHLTSVGCALSPTPFLPMHLWGFAGCGDIPTLEQPNKY